MLLKDYYPPHLANSKTFGGYLKSAQIEHNRLDANIQDVINQLFVETATWGLDAWEKFLRITITSKPYEYRRSVILAKLRGAGTTTKQVIKDMALAFQNGQVDVIENPEDESFKVKFTSIKGIPPNLQDFVDAINEIKPAHLGFSYELTYTIWEEVKAQTWGQLKSKTWGQVLNT